MCVVGGGMESPEAVHYSVDIEAHKYVPERRIGPTSIFFFLFVDCVWSPGATFSGFYVPLGGLEVRDLDKTLTI